MGLIDVDELLKYANEEITSVFAYPQGRRADEEKAHRKMWTNIRNILLSAPIVDAEPIKHGRWVNHISENGATDGIYCSVCDYEIGRNVRYNYCPNCGAKMDGNWEEPAINPCRGCEDYDGKGGCISKGGCGAKTGGGENEYWNE